MYSSCQHEGGGAPPLNWDGIPRRAHATKLARRRMREKLLISNKNSGEERKPHLLRKKRCLLQELLGLWGKAAMFSSRGNYFVLGQRRPTSTQHGSKNRTLLIDHCKRMRVKYCVQREGTRQLSQTRKKGKRERSVKCGMGHGPIMFTKKCKKIVDWTGVLHSFLVEGKKKGGASKAVSRRYQTPDRSAPLLEEKTQPALDKKKKVRRLVKPRGKEKGLRKQLKKAAREGGKKSASFFSRFLGEQRGRRLRGGAPGTCLWKEESSCLSGSQGSSSSPISNLRESIPQKELGRETVWSAARCTLKNWVFSLERKSWVAFEGRKHISHHTDKEKKW